MNKIFTHYKVWCYNKLMKGFFNKKKEDTKQMEEAKQLTDCAHTALVEDKGMVYCVLCGAVVKPYAGNKHLPDSTQ